MRRWGRALLALALLLGPAGVRAEPAAASLRFREHEPAVFAEARRRQRPVFVLVAATWCHWCARFKRDTLATEKVSAYLKRHYLSVLVDVDRRPDLAQLYAERGLPTSVLLDPEGRVRRSFAGVLEKDDFLAVLEEVVREMRTAPAPGAEPVAVPPPALPSLPVAAATYGELVQRLLRAWDALADTTHGGLGTGSKRPHGRLLGYLLERPEVMNDASRMAGVEKTLAGIRQGLFDPVAGGFFNYAGRRDWGDARSEKLLAVNAAVVLAFERAHLVSGDPRHAEAVDATASYLLRTLFDPAAGGFFGSQSADPAYYLLAPPRRNLAPPPPVNREKIAVSNAQAALALLALRPTARHPESELKGAAFRTLDFMRERLLTRDGMYDLYDARTGKGHRLGQLEANAWAALAFLEAQRVSGRPAYRQAGENLLAYAQARLFDAERGVFANRKGAAGGASVGPLALEANGVMAEALIEGHRATGRTAYLERARQLLGPLGARVDALLGDEEAEAAKLEQALAEAVSTLRAYGRLFPQERKKTDSGT